MDVRRHRYAVDGWGLGELYVCAGVVVAHELPSPWACGGPRARPEARAHLPQGTPESPDITLAERSAPLGDDFVPSSSPGRGPAAGTGGREASAAGREAALVSGVVARVRRQLAGHETSYRDVPLDLSWCTPFQAALARALRAVPWGEVVTYGELAALAGRREAPRAAGAFCARNRFPLLLPCHRVVAAVGIGGYGAAGASLKRRLLALEGVEL